MQKSIIRGALYGVEFNECNKPLSLYQESIAKSDEAHPKQKLPFTKPISSTQIQFFFFSQSQWGFWPLLVEWPLDVLEPQNKNEDIAHYERKQIVLSLTGFVQQLNPGRVIDLRLTKIVNFLFGWTHQKVL